MRKATLKTIRQCYKKALHYCNRFELHHAEALLGDILRDDPTFWDARSTLALLSFLKGQTDSQEEILLGTLKENPTHYPTLHQLGFLRLTQSSFNDALVYSQAALEQRPEAIDSLLLAAKACLYKSDHPSAEVYAQRILQLSNGWHPAASSVKAEIYIATHKSKTPIESLFEIIIDDPEDFGAYNALLALAENSANANHILSLAIDILKHNPDAKLPRLLRIGILKSQGKVDDCFDDLYYLLSLFPSDISVLHQFAEAYILLKCYRESAEVYLRIARRYGITTQILNQIGVCYRGIGKLHSARKAFLRSLARNPVDSVAISNLGEVEFRTGKLDAAKRLYSIALNINPRSRAAFSNLMFVYSVGNSEDMSKMLLLADSFWSNEVNVQAVSCSTEASTKDSASRQIPLEFIDSRVADRVKRVRIGILTADIGNHCVSYFLAPLLKYYDRSKLSIELILCDRRYEEREKLICNWAEHIEIVDPNDEIMSRAIIKRRSYDIIIECNGYTGGTGIGILSARCAPLQCHYIGYHGSTGLNTIDYFISDSYIITPKIEEQLSERSLRLDRAWLAFYPFEPPPPAKAVATACRPVLGFFGNSAKITSRTLEFWSALMESSPDSILALKCPSYNDKEMATKIIDRLSRVGIDEERLVLLSPTPTWLGHMESYNLIDYALDSTPWSSATTAFDCLAMGVPILAIEGDTIASRMSSSLAFHLGHAEWIAKNAQDYADFGHLISERFMEARNRKQELQRQVLGSSLFDGQSLARSLETALLKLHHSRDHV